MPAGSSTDKTRALRVENPRSACAAFDRLRVSITAELWPELIQQLTGHPSAPRLLGSLARANVFVERIEGAPGAHRIHPLFREMLAAQLAYEFPEEFAALHRRW